MTIPSPWQELMAATLLAHQRLETQTGAWLAGYRLLGGATPCGRGCSACCTLNVTTTFPEARLISEGLTEVQRQRLLDRARFILQRLRGVTDLKEFLHLHRTTVGACPLLEADGSCGIYHLRPLACRALISTRESSWCSVDFGTLTSSEKQAFMDGLDRSVVDFPLHYAALPRQMAQQHEAQLSGLMAERFGYAVTGSLPHLVFLELEHGLGSLLAQDQPDRLAPLREKGLLHPLLVDLSPRKPCQNREKMASTPEPAMNEDSPSNENRQICSLCGG